MFEPSAKPLRLLSVGYLPPEWGGSQRGGVATFHAALLRELASRRIPVECTGVLVAPRDEIDRRRTRRVGAPVIPLPRPQGRERAYGRALRRARPDVVLFNHSVNRAVASLVRAHRRMAPEIPSVGVIHSWHPITQAAEGRFERRRERAREMLASVDAVAFGSEHCRREGVELGLEYPPLARVIRYPLAHAYVSPLAGIPSRRRGVLYVGSLIPRKNLEPLIEAVAGDPGLELTLAGEGPEEGRLRSLAEGLGAAGRIRLLRHFPVRSHLRRMRGLMRGAEVLCLPSTSESFGLVLAEALACGTPVVGFAPTLSELERFAGRDCGEPLDAPTTEEIGAAIQRVRARRWDRGSLRRAVVRAFHPRRTAEGYADLLHAAAEARAGALGAGAR